MRLLYVIDSLAGGGAETSLAEMTPHLVADSVELHVLPLKEPLDLSARMEQSGAVVHHPAQRASRGQYLRRVHEVTRSVRPDLIHTTLFVSSRRVMSCPRPQAG